MVKFTSNNTKNAELTKHAKHTKHAKQPKHKPSTKTIQKSITNVNPSHPQE